MTANNVICQPKHRCIQIATDGATYDDRGVVTAIESKVRAVPEWSTVILGRGNAFGIDTAVRCLKARSSGFDDLIGGVTGELQKIVDTHRLDRPFELVIAGFSKCRAKPEIYFIRTPGHDSSGVGLRPFVAFPMGNSLLGPWPSDDLITASRFVEPDPDESPKKVARSLRKLLEMQRRVLADDGAPRVGGFIEITTITPEEIKQQIIPRWPEDRVGERMTPAPIVWTKWNREHGF